VQCPDCDTVYAPQPPDPGFLAQAYQEAAYGSGTEADQAGATYARILAPFLRELTDKDLAVDVGAGNGALLPHLLRAGFSKVIGIEPSQEAIAAADPTVRPFLRQGVFTPETISEPGLGLVCVFMTLEHVPDPLALLRAAMTALAPGGLVAVVVHDHSAALNRLLGARSPIIDVEHLQLFSPRSIRAALARSGFAILATRRFANTYSLGYWTRLLPLPGAAKNKLLNILAAASLDRLPICLPVGNLLAVGKKPMS
jgi:SAM-dependent methyltransferase